MQSTILIVLLLGLSILSPQHASAEVDTLWTRIFAYTTEGPSVEQTHDGGFIVATMTSMPPDYDIQVVKTDDLGEVQWSKTYDLDRNVYDVVSIKQLQDRGYVLCGGFVGGMCTGPGLLMRLDARGDSLWTRMYDYDLSGCHHCVQQTSDGGFIFAGGGACSGVGGWATLLKTDGDGNVEWDRYWGFHAPSTYFKHVVELSNGQGYAAVGTIHSDVFFVKTDLDGNETASKVYGEHSDYGYEICEAHDGGFIMCGLWSIDHDPYACLIRTDAAGDTLWTRMYGTPGQWAIALSVVETSHETFLAVGESGEWADRQMWIFETDTTGDSLWSQSFDIFSDVEYARRIRLTSDGGYVVAGGGKSHPDQPYSLFLMRLEESVIDVASSNGATPSAVYLQPNVPNPFYSTTTIRYHVPEQSDVQIRIHDPMGRLVRALPIGLRPAGIYSVTWDGTNQAGSPAAGGVYFCRLLLNGEIQTRRIVLMR